MALNERVAREEEKNRNQDKNIDDLYSKWEKTANCVRRIEKTQWIAMGQSAGIAVLLAFVLGKLYGGI